MAVTYVEGSNPWGTTGNLLTTAGLMIPGAQFLVPLGMGMSAMSSGGGLGSVKSDSVFGGIMSNILKNGWKNPASGSVASGGLGNVASNAQKAMQAASGITNPLSDYELARKWGGYI